MKAIFAAICFLAAAMLTIAQLPENVCRAAHAETSCAAGTPLTWLFYFNNGTDQCEKYYGCGGGLNDFDSKRSCETSCPYGKNKPKPSKS
uniref:Putative tick kunitz 53 n=1 Tax=Ixodes ricinus TaxID=34613 RepID=V5H7K4_IXORI